MHQALQHYSDFQQLDAASAHRLYSITTQKVTSCASKFAVIDAGDNKAFQQVATTPLTTPASLNRL
jgi:hypothetical protein